ncbi:hypothetical protein [Nocardia sp. NPDC003963]
MGIFGFTWADGGAFAGGALGAAFLGPPGAMLGSAAGSFVGAAWGDDKETGAALEEALVAGIGAAGGAWATNLAGALLKDGVAAATRTLSAGTARRADRIAARTLLPWNARGGGPIAALGGAFGGYEVSVQARLPVRIETTDIGNGGCPAQLASLRMPADLTGPVGAMYRELPAYLCDVWRSFGTGPRQAPPAPRVPAMPGGAEPSGIAEYAAKVRRLDTMTAGFAQLDARAVALIADGTGRITAEGRTAVGSLVDTVNRRAAETPPPGTSAPIHALDLLNEAFERGREILSQAVTAGDRVAGQVRGLTDEVASLREQLYAHRTRPAPEGEPPAPPVPAPPPTAVPGSYCPTPPAGPPHSRPDGIRSGARESAAADSAADQRRPAPEPPPATGSGGVVDAAPGPCPTPWSRSAESGQVTASHAAGKVLYVTPINRCTVPYSAG